MDKRTAKREALKMWKWLSEHDGADKHTYVIASGIDIFARFRSGCALCVYEVAMEAKHANEYAGGCPWCPLWKGGEGCYSRKEASPYYRWSHGHRSEDALGVYSEIKAWKVR